MYIPLRTRLRTPLRVYGKIPRENARVGHAHGHGQATLQFIPFL